MARQAGNGNVTLVETKDDVDVFTNQIHGTNGVKGYSKPHVTTNVLSLDPPQQAETMMKGLEPDQVENATGYSVSDIPLGTIKAARIITIGAGASGINMAYQAKRHLKNVTLAVYEKNTGAGGTWFENRYPGCKCDIPSHNYQFSWEPNPNWNHMFSPQEEIRRYLEHCVAKYDLGTYIHLNHRVSKARWNEVRGIWHVEIIDNATNTVIHDWCNFLLHAGGILNHWTWPDIPSLHTFKGDLVHSANWPDGLDLQDKVVAVIGNGSTGIQIVPAIQPMVKQLIHFIRSPTWVTPGAASRYPSLRGGQMPESFSEEQKEVFRASPEKYMAFRKAVEREVNAKFRMLVNGAEAAEVAKADATSSMLSLLGPQAAEMADQLIPDFSVGCRRITPGVGYLESFSKPNVRVITKAIISSIDETGITMASGEHITVDVIVCATGFDVSFSPRFPITGRDGTSLGDVWSAPRIPQAYLSMAIPKFPNYFTFLGPNAPISHGSVFTITEQCSKYIMQFITKSQVEMIKAVDVKAAAVDDFAIHIAKFMPRTAWAGKCRSWFKNGKVTGPVIAIHPGSRLHWFHALERPKFEDFEYTYDTGNRFQYLGSGFSVREETDDNQTWYLDEVDPKYLYY